MNAQNTKISRRGLMLGTAALVATSAMPSFAKEAITQFKPTGSASVDHAALSAILSAVVKRDAEGYHQVDYKVLKGDRAPLKAYLAAMAKVDPVTLSSDEAHAYWVNLYNAVTLDIVVEHYPVSSIKKINLGGGGLFGSGPWSKPLITISGQELTLDDIEHRIVRGLFNDPMSHYGLNCASYSCPNLETEAYTGANINDKLAKSARDYIGHKRGVRVRRDRITASKIFSWYADDFGGEDKLKAHWAEFATAEKAAEITAADIRNYTYDWSLNDV